MIYILKRAANQHLCITTSNHPSNSSNQPAQRNVLESAWGRLSRSVANAADPVAHHTHTIVTMCWSRVDQCFWSRSTMQAVLREGNMQRAPAKNKYDSTTRTPTLPLDRPQPLLVVLPPLRNSRSEFERRALHAGSTGKRMTHHAIGIIKDGAHMDRCELSLAASCPRRGTSRSSPKCSGRTGQKTECLRCRFQLIPLVHVK